MAAEPAGGDPAGVQPGPARRDRPPPGAVVRYLWKDDVHSERPSPAPALASRPPQLLHLQRVGDGRPAGDRPAAPPAGAAPGPHLHGNGHLLDAAGPRPAADS